MKSDEMEFSSPFKKHSLKLLAIPTFFVMVKHPTLCNNMMKNKHATDPRNGIQIAASSSSEVLKTIYWPMSTKLKCLFPKLNNVPTQRTQKIVKMAPFPAFSLIISFEYMHDKDNEYALNMYLWSKSSFSCGNRSRAAFFDVSLGTFNFLTVTFKMVIFVKWYLSSKTVKKVWSSYNWRQN